MSSSFQDHRSRAEQYAERKKLQLDDQLGFGNQGTVFATDVDSAIKVHERETFYQRERSVYFRLYQHRVSDVCGCAVPTLIDYDNVLWIVEMTVVARPFVLDFASAYLDVRPDYSPEIMDEWQQEKQELFEDQWPDVQLILFQLERYGIYLYDVHPGNIRLTK
jgi:hypothetical protein